MSQRARISQRTPRIFHRTRRPRAEHPGSPQRPGRTRRTVGVALLVAALAVGSAASAEARAASAGSPLPLWRITGVEPGSSAVYVMGTVAMADSAKLRFDPAVMSAFRRSSRLVLPNSAVLSKQNALIGWKAHLAEGDALRSWLSPELYARYTRAIERGGFPAGTAEVTAPWFAARIVRMADLRRTGFVDEGEFEIYFTHLARYGAGGIEIVPLEESATTYDRYAALSRAVQSQLMDAALDESDAASETLPETLDAWRRGAIAPLGARIDATAKAHPERAESRELTRARENERLAEAIPGLLRDADPRDSAFFLIDIRNLAGSDGVLALAAARGLRVEQVTAAGDDAVGSTSPDRRARAPQEPRSTEASADRAPAPHRQRVLLLGIDGATLRVIGPLLEAHRMPNLAAIAREGASGPLRSHRPIYSPRIWNSIATGKIPARHGIEGFTYKDEEGRQRLYLSLHRKTHALWNIASDAGLRVGVVNWWNTYPPEVINGVMVSDHAKPTRLAELKKLTGAVTPEAEGETVFPPEWGPRVQGIFAARQPLTTIPDPFLGNVGIAPFMQKEELSKRFYDDAAATRIALAVDAALRPDLLMAFLPGIDRVSHRLWASIEPPELYEGTLSLNPRQRRAAREALYAYYEYSDALIGLLLEGFGPDDLVVVVSDHGFEAGEHLGDLTGVHDTEEALDGILFARGPGIEPGASTRGISVNDITPTILAWLGLPLGRDMDGHPASFLEPPRGPAPLVDTHDTGPVERLGKGPSGSEGEILEQLRALGYIE